MRDGRLRDTTKTQRGRIDWATSLRKKGEKIIPFPKVKKKAGELSNKA